MSDDDTQRRGDGQREEEMRVDKEEGRIAQGPTEVWFKPSDDPEDVRRDRKKVMDSPSIPVYGPGMRQ